MNRDDDHESYGFATTIEMVICKKRTTPTLTHTATTTVFLLLLEVLVTGLAQRGNV